MKQKSAAKGDVAKPLAGPARKGAAGKPRKPAAPVAVEVEAVRERVKLVRDSFTMPRDEFELIDQLKERATGFRRPTKKSELLRAGLQVLSRLDDAQLLASLSALRPLKAGRPKNKH